MKLCDWLWLAGFIRAILDWLKDLRPDKIEPIEHVDPKSPDASPPVRTHHKLAPVDTRPGQWNRETGSFNE